jgi:hypothetical protein
MVQELKNINDIYLNLFHENKLNISKFIEINNINDCFVEQYYDNLRLIKLLSEDSISILEINCFYNLSSISLLAGNAKKIIKISNNINLSYYELINYINDVELLLYEDFDPSLNSLNVDFLYINNFHHDENYTLYNKVFENVKVEKYIMIDGINEYFYEKIKPLIEKNNWKIYEIKKEDFNFLILKRI